MLETSFDICNSMGMNQKSNVIMKKSLKWRKRSKIINKANINTSSQSGSPSNPHEYRLLFNVVGELEEFDSTIYVLSHNLAENKLYF